MVTVEPTKRIVVIEWDDCENGEGWHSQLAIDDYCQRPLAVISSVGWLLYEGEHWIIIAQSLGEDDPELAGDLLKVPRAMIRKMEILESPNGSKPKSEGA